MAGFDETVKKVTKCLLDVSGEAKVDYLKKKEETLKKISFSCFGDFYSNKVVPCNFADAQDYIKELPSLIKTTDVPVTVTLVPLESLGLGCENKVSK